MRLPERFVITITGEVSKVRSRDLIVPTALPHLLTYLLSGREMTAQPFEPFGLRVHVEEDTDQGPE